MSEHTPTPWISEQLPGSEYVGERFVVRHCYKDSGGVAWTQYACVCEGARAKDDSRFIARACNLYERMRDMLREMYDSWVPDGHSQSNDGYDGTTDCAACASERKLEALLNDIDATEKEPS